ncbi:HAD family phosphatase [Sphingobacterium sp. SRCM116780]|uniref:HAD family hydrolase n=1 Tax=Sphingobacterium sp. SRCM116780 TaxID=2907623 RepID=UPI001F1F69AD|nr:HAD-IA family hydrolase [Sphingobacterium sp. SRCM116780]UIR57741.1 HAD family phosphatase [Sphingobacterium sp. SRCM116780]
MSPESIEKFNKLNEIAASYDALLFDVDGTLADNMHAHKAAYVATAAEYGVTLDDRLIDETAGWPTVAVAQEIGIRYQKTFDVVEFSKRKSTIFIERFVQQTQPIDYVVEHLKFQIGKKRIAAVSGGTRSTLTITLTVIDVLDKLETLVCAGDTLNGKPSPEPFLLAAERLQIEPSKCLVYEDGEPGVQGATAAGMGSVRIDLLD